MTIGIIGTGAIGEAIARDVVKAGYSITLSNSRWPESLRALAEELGPRAQPGSVRDAAAADLVFLAVPWTQLKSALADLPPWGGRIVVDATNPIVRPGFTVAVLAGRTSSEVVAGLVPGARLVKAFNTLPPPLLLADPIEGDGHRVLFLSGDDDDARATVAKLIEAMGFAPVDLGTLVEGGKLQQFPHGPLPTLDLVKFSKTR